MIVASYNINGIRARLPRVLDWIDEVNPDVILLQEIKCVDEQFPRATFEDRGFSVETHGQKGFNGVAILSRFPLEDVRRGLPGDEFDTQARWIEALVLVDRPVRVCGLYLPNGNPSDGPKYQYKLSWMERLLDRSTHLLGLEERTLLAGDFNVIPQSEDAENPDDWKEDALFLYRTREAWRKVLCTGYVDAFRATRPRARSYTFWDFQRGAWERNNGIRIDHFLLSPQCADVLDSCEIDRHVRGWERPSDHVPIRVNLDV